MNTTCRDTGTNNNGGYVNPRACFQRDILPVLLSGCGISGCHDATTKAGDYVFIDYATTLKSLKPGDPDESEIYEKITEKDLNDRMPPAGYDPLPPAQIDSIYQWILYGALNEECGQACDTTSVITWSEHIWPIIGSNCRGCHSGASPSGNIPLTSYTQVSAIAANGKLTGVLRATGGNQQMPPSGALPFCSIRQIELWVESGYQNN
jgi:mono/diheme cytochrome c family protein